jgi:heterodisulfide reductase subunit A
MAKVLVVGGGVAGMQTSLDLARMGHLVYLVEKEKTLGGNLKRLHQVFPSNEKAEETLKKYTKQIAAESLIKVFTESTLVNIEGKAPTFNATIQKIDLKSNLTVAAVVLATGFQLYDVSRKNEFGYGRYKDILSAIDLERMLREKKLERPSDAGRPSSIVFVQCVGFRDVKANPYCSSFCCKDAVKNATIIKKEHPEIDIAVMYMDIRTPSLCEQMYWEAKSLGIKFIRSKPAEIFEKDGKVIISFENTLTGKVGDLESDLVVLSVGAVPTQETEELSKIVNLPLSETGFFKTELTSLGRGARGIFVAGANCGPKDIAYSISEAGATAAQVSIALRNIDAKD